MKSKELEEQKEIEKDLAKAERTRREIRDQVIESTKKCLVEFLKDQQHEFEKQKD